VCGYAINYPQLQNAFSC